MKWITGVRKVLTSRNRGRIIVGERGGDCSTRMGPKRRENENQSGKLGPGNLEGLSLFHCLTSDCGEPYQDGAA